MSFFRSSMLIKSLQSRGKQCNKIQGHFHQKAIGSLNRSLYVQFYSAVAFNVRRSEPELVRPSRPTPNKIKILSDIDNHLALRFRLPMIMFYPAVPNMKEKDPAKVIKKALAEALVYYYPWAGRLRHRTIEKLEVDCTAEGVVFVEADADISLQQFGEQPLLPPNIVLKKLLYSENDNVLQVVGCPILTIQVTRLSCGGFILALSYAHPISDGVGLSQFLTAITEFARGASAPSVLPVWRRDLHISQGKGQETPNIPPSVFATPNDIVRRIFTFNARDVATLRARIPPHLAPSTTTFELIVATLWRCRTIALEYKPNEQVYLAFPINIRNKFNPPLPVGYYGNAIASAIAVSPASKLYDDDSLGYAVEQVKKAKDMVTEEHERSLIIPALLRAQHLLTVTPQLYTISDASRLGISNLDFGWGKSVYSCPVDNIYLPHLTSLITTFRNLKGEEVKVVPVHLSEDAVDRFTNTLANLMKDQ